MSTIDFLTVLTILADPTPYEGYGWQVETELANRDHAAEALRTTTYGTPEWRDAEIARNGAEARLADLFDIQPKPLPIIDFDDHFTLNFA